MSEPIFHKTSSSGAGLIVRQIRIGGLSLELEVFSAQVLSDRGYPGYSDA